MLDAKGKGFMQLLGQLQEVADDNKSWQDAATGYVGYITPVQKGISLHTLVG